MEADLVAHCGSSVEGTYLFTFNGTEFINETLLAYCEAEQITFTRGRPAFKNDQCHVEQKNGDIVRALHHGKSYPMMCCSRPFSSNVLSPTGSPLPVSHVF
ncbi:hypothetical protein ccbrp13_63180 [Ktedonobacteria bacterium brp13]|nr:hypothetical protein ccbrp13_63180 [Ktedonobacteria bacterium brp13]